jgi:hypothetical protein
MRILLVMLILVAVGAQSADAQRRRQSNDDDWFDWWGPVQFGVRGGYSFDEEVGSAGTQFRIPIVSQFWIVPSADVFLGDSATTDWQINGDAVIAPDGLGGLYGGIGAALLDHGDQPDDDGDEEDDDPRWGLNLFAGLDGGSLFDASLRPFVEARWTLLDEVSPFRLSFGINVPIR